jgi:hypothetical protein
MVRMLPYGQIIMYKSPKPLSGLGNINYDYDYIYFEQIYGD